MIERFARFPAYLAERSRSLLLDGEIPALLAHPDWEKPAPVVLWLHGRTVNKELDPGRYLRWIRAGIAACAVDLPGHGERADHGMQQPARSLDVLSAALPEIDRIVAALRAAGSGVFDTARMGIGGMSLGGMITLRRLCDPHLFACASVESTTGNLAALYHPDAERRWPVSHPAERIQPLDPIQNLERWRPIPVLWLHSESDTVVPIAGMRQFDAALRAHYASAGASQDMVQALTWPATGAALEHSGFGRVSNDAKNAQTEFFVRHLSGADPR